MSKPRGVAVVFKQEGHRSSPKTIPNAPSGPRHRNTRKRTQSRMCRAATPRAPVKSVWESVAATCRTKEKEPTCSTFRPVLFVGDGLVYTEQTASTVGDGYAGAFVSILFAVRRRLKWSLLAPSNAPPQPMAWDKRNRINDRAPDRAFQIDAGVSTILSFRRAVQT